MVEKTVSTRFKIVGRSAKCKGGHSVVEQSAYISRTTMKSEYDGRTYYPKYSEDLVHVEISLPENAPEAYKDRAVLWNSVETFEKRADAQLARTNRFPLPNDWSYETAVAAMRDYIQRNFVSRGMCCEWAVHDSENPKTGQRNLHCHIMLTMRPILEDGTWGARQRKIYKYDEHGNKIKKKNGRYDCTTEDIMGWSDKKNAMMWRQDFADTVNAVNEKLKLDEHWDHRSYKERGLDIEPTVHLGPKAAALERQGIRTERGDINREVKKRNAMIASLKRVIGGLETEINNIRIEAKKAVQEVKADVAETVSKVKDTVVVKKAAVAGKTTEMLAFIRKVADRIGRFHIPIQRGFYVKSISDRETLRDPEKVKAFVTDNEIETFKGLRTFMRSEEKKHERTVKDYKKKKKRKEHLEKLYAKWEKYKPYKSIVDAEDELKLLDKPGYIFEHRKDYAEAKKLRAELNAALEEGDTKEPTKWKKDIETLGQEMETLLTETQSAAVNLAYCETINYTREAMQQGKERGSLTARLQKHNEEKKKRDAERTQMPPQPKRNYEPEL